MLRALSAKLFSINVGVMIVVLGLMLPMVAEAKGGKGRGHSGHAAHGYSHGYKKDKPKKYGHDAKKSDDDCPCGTGRQCMGPRGGMFCFSPSGKKRYF
ncbi:MAG: hypothetical protein ACMV0H_03590 [Aquaspirillum sp.]